MKINICVSDRITAKINDKFKTWSEKNIKEIANIVSNAIPSTIQWDKLNSISTITGDTLYEW